MRGAAGPALLALLLAAGGCGDRPAPPPAPLETVDVDAAPDAELSTADDPQAAPRGPEVAGVLPGGVPRDLPLYKPSSLVAYGEVSAGRHFIVLDTPDPPAGVRGWLDQRLAAAGWQPAGPGAWRHPRGDRRLTVTFEPLGRGTRLRLEYPPEP